MACFVTNCVDFIPYACLFRQFYRYSYVARFNDFFKMRHRYIACLVKNGEQMILYMKS